MSGLRRLGRECSEVGPLMPEGMSSEGTLDIAEKSRILSMGTRIPTCLPHPIGGSAYTRFASWENSGPAEELSGNQPYVPFPIRNDLVLKLG